MSSAKHSVQDEAQFMELLLSGLDASIFEGGPSPEPTPQKRQARSSRPNASPLKQKQHSPAKKKEAEKENIFTAEDMAMLLEGAEDWDWDDVLSPPRKKPKLEEKKNSSKSAPLASKSCIRCIADSVEMVDGKKIVASSCKTDGSKKTIVLENDWAAIDIRVGDTFNVIGQYQTFDTTIHVSPKRNLLILHPDVLLTVTSIANAGRCARKPLLSQLIRSSSDVSPSLVFGNILHDVMQRCLLSGKWDAISISAFVHEAVQGHLTALFHLKMNEDEAEREVMSRAENLFQFSRRYINNSNMGTRTENDISISKVYCVEEDILAPKYGLKGKVDASVLLKPSRSTKSEGGAETKYGVATPLEIKTGRTVAGIEHRAQTILYTILMAERYGHAFPSGADQPSRSGVLYYTHGEDLIQVPANWNELRGLIMTRNDLATYLARREAEQTQVILGGQDQRDSFLPDTIDSERTCGRCYVSDACMLYKKAIDRSGNVSSPISDLIKIKTGHLTEEQLDFFKHWEHLLSLEEQHQYRFRKELWSLGAHERQRFGRCISDLVLDPSYAGQDRRQNVRNAQSNQYSYRFIPNPDDPVLKLEASIRRSLLEGQIDIGDAVSISVSGNDRLLALSRGFVKEILPDSITVGVDQVLSVDFIRERCPQYATSDVIFRVDKDEMAGGMARVRDNLAQLFYVSGTRRLLEQVVDLKRPEFFHEFALDKQGQLNEAQKDAIGLILRAKDYALILGMPGTGKTTTIACLIGELVSRGKTVLLSSHTHSAVDTILLKMEVGLRSTVLRLGNMAKIHPRNQSLALEARGTITTVKELEERLLAPKVVACTALSVDHPIFQRRHFDYCIVDEASQITLPTCLGPLRHADKFILVGDHHQLSAVVRSKAAQKGGLDVSLFKRLSEAHPQAVASLNWQYRMNEDIMLLSNNLIYKNNLVCGSEKVAKQALKLPLSPHTICGCSEHRSGCWIQDVLKESCRAVFVDTDSVPALDSYVGNLVQNTTEANLVTQLTKALLFNGIKEEQIGIISLYRQQIKLLTSQLLNHQGIEILTADRSQGRDKDCIVISLVRANAENNIGDLLKDWRRINVAFTRARSKLVIFGSRKTLNTSPLLTEFFTLMESKKWVLPLSPNAHLLHKEVDHSSSNSGRARPEQPKQSSVDVGVLRSRPVLRDVVNDFL